MGAPFKQLSIGVEGNQRQRMRKSRSSLGGTDSISMSQSGDGLRTKSTKNQSLSDGRQRAVSRSNSLSNEEHCEDGSGSWITSSGAQSRIPSKDRTYYLSQRASEKKESKERKSSVLGSLNAFLNEENNKPRVPARRRDAHSVFSSASSRRRRRSHTPSSASVVSGISVTREELHLQRRSRSNPPGQLDRMIQELRTPNRNRQKSSGEIKSRESSRSRDTFRDTGKESTSRAEPGRPDPTKTSSRRKDASRSRTRSASVSTRGGQLVQTLTQTPAKARSTGSVKPPSMEFSLSPVGTLSKTFDQATLSLGGGAEIPPGFPVAAVDNRGQSTTENGKGGEDSPHVLDSTARLRERQAGVSKSTNLTSHGSDIADPVEGPTQRRSRSILGSTMSPGVENHREKTHTGGIEDRRKTLRATRSESVKFGNHALLRRNNAFVGSPSFHRQCKKSISDSDIGTNKPSRTAQRVDQAVEKPGVSKELEEKRSTRRSQSPGTLAKKTPAHPEEFSTDRKGETEKYCPRNLSNVDQKKTLNKASKRNKSSEIIASSAALERRKSGSSEGRRLKKKSGKKTAKAPLGEITDVHDDEGNESEKRCSSHGQTALSRFERFDSSIDSLDVDLLTNSPSTHKVSSVDQMFDDDDDQEDKQNQHDMPSLISTDAAHVTRDILNSRGKDETRLSWIELPLFDPQQLLVKSSDCDGANETSELSSHVRSTDILRDPIFADEEEKKDKKKANPSLRSVIDKDKAKRQASQSRDGKTVITTTTTTSDATTKTTNKDPTVKKSARTKAKVDDLGASQNSMTIDQLDFPEAGEQGSLYSLSRSSNRGKGNSRRSKGSLGSKGSFSDSSASVGKSKTRRCRNTGESSEKVKDNNRLVNSSSRCQLQRQSSEYNGKGRQSPHHQQIVEPLMTTALDGEDHSILKKKAKSESPGTINRKKSYLSKRKTDKAEAKYAVNTSLDTFLKQVEQAAPVVKDDNRSVYSSMHEKDRHWRQRENNRDMIHSRPISRMEQRRWLDSALGLEALGIEDGGKSDDDTDNMSIASAPLLISKSRSTIMKRLQNEEPQLESQRPVVDLKKTQFSNKLTKLHVEF
jgi:hypothetical protein